MAEEKLVNVALTKTDLQVILNWQTLTAIHFDVTEEEEILRKKLWVLYKKEYGGKDDGRSTDND